MLHKIYRSSLLLILLISNCLGRKNENLFALFTYDEEEKVGKRAEGSSESPESTTTLFYHNRLPLQMIAR